MVETFPVFRVILDACLSLYQIMGTFCTMWINALSTGITIGDQTLTFLTVAFGLGIPLYIAWTIAKYFLPFA